MPSVVTDPLTQLRGGQWPQDTLSPPIQSGMPPIARSNANIKREPYALVGKLLQINYGMFNLTIPVPPRGDFWCRYISGFSPTGANNDATRDQPHAHVRMSDVRTGYNFFNPYIWFAMLVGTGPVFTTSGLIPGTTANNLRWNAHALSDLPELYCFTRNTTISIMVTRVQDAGLAANDPVDLYFSLSGWLEYANASGG